MGKIIHKEYTGFLAKPWLWFIAAFVTAFWVWGYIPIIQDPMAQWRRPLWLHLTHYFSIIPIMTFLVMIQAHEAVKYGTEGIILKSGLFYGLFKVKLDRRRISRISIFQPQFRDLPVAPASFKRRHGHNRLEDVVVWNSNYLVPYSDILSKADQAAPRGLLIEVKDGRKYFVYSKDPDATLEKLRDYYPVAGSVI